MRRELDVCSFPSLFVSFLDEETAISVDMCEVLYMFSLFTGGCPASGRPVTTSKSVAVRFSSVRVAVVVVQHQRTGQGANFSRKLAACLRTGD